jgi:hypothetical protein
LKKLQDFKPVLNKNSIEAKLTTTAASTRPLNPPNQEILSPPAAEWFQSGKLVLGGQG